MRQWGYFLFFVSFFCLYFTAGMYVSWRLCAGLDIAAPYKHIIFFFCGFMSAASTAAYVSSEYGIVRLAAYLNRACGIWMGFLGIASSVLFVNDLLNLSGIFENGKFGYYSALFSLALITALCLWSLINAGFILKVKEIKIKVPQLKTGKLRIVCLADVHIDKQTSYGSIKKIVKAVNAVKPDMIAIAGDLIDTDISGTFRGYGLDKLYAPYGIYAVTGNHEYYAGIENYAKLCDRLGIKLLNNENLPVLNEKGENIIFVAGVNDRQSRHFKAGGIDIEAAFSGIGKNAPVLFLSHRPEEFDKVKDREMSVMQLSGHTHCGQIPPVEIIRKFMKYNYGLYEYKNSKMYVTSGCRWWRVPMRTFNKCEIAHIVLERE